MIALISGEIVFNGSVGMRGAFRFEFFPWIIVALFLFSCKPVTTSSTPSVAGKDLNTYPAVPTHLHQIEFAVTPNHDSLYIVSASRKLLVENCKLLQHYANYLRRRNSQNLLASESSACLPEVLTESEKNSFQSPSESSYASGSFFPAFLRGSSEKINITNIFPREIFSRSRKNVVYDGICFNSAMVASGIFRFSDYSRFEPPVEGLLGYWQLSSSVSNKGMLLSFQRSSWFSQTVKNEKSWEATSQNIVQTQSEVSDYIRTHFSPGSVLCISSEKLVTAGEKAAELKLSIARSAGTGSVSVNVSDSGAILGRRGAHCAVFVTPHLIVESSNDRPHSLISWAKAFPYYWNWMGGKHISLHYSQIDLEGVLRWAAQTPLFQSSSRFSMVQNELRNFHNAYDGKSGITVGTMVMLVGKLKTALNGPIFRDFVEARDGVQFGNSSADVGIAYDYWHFVIETIAHLESNLNASSPSSPWSYQSL
jgi:hypothetical protein